MKFKRKKIAIFIVMMISLSILFFILLNFALPIKTSMISGKIGKYTSEDILFHAESETYNVNDVILYNPSSIEQTIFAEIVEINLDGTFKVIGTNPEPIDDLDQNNLKKEQIIGKVISSISAYIFYPLFMAINLILAFALTHFISKKIKTSQM